MVCAKPKVLFTKGKLFTGALAYWHIFMNWHRFPQSGVHWSFIGCPQNRTRIDTVVRLHFSH